jgi:ADP-ribose pyrophosphatase YjhB (NUDIX family)
MHRYKIHKSNLVYKSKWLQVYEDLINCYNDNNNKNNCICSNSGSSHSIKIFNRIKADDTVIIIPIFENGLLLLVEGYRHGVNASLLEFPGGFIDKNEEPSEAERRELFEETNYTCDSLELVSWFYTWPGRTDQKNYVFVAKGLKNNNDILLQNNNNNIQSYEKDVKVYILSREQIIEELKNGTRIKSSPIISALFFAKEAQRI